MEGVGKDVSGLPYKVLCMILEMKIFCGCDGHKKKLYMRQNFIELNTSTDKWMPIKDEIWIKWVDYIDRKCMVITCNYSYTDVIMKEILKWGVVNGISLLSYNCI